LEKLVFEERGKPEKLVKNLSGKSDNRWGRSYKDKWDFD